MAVTSPYPEMSTQSRLKLSGHVVRPELTEAPSGFLNSIGIELSEIQVDKRTGAIRTLSGHLYDSVLESGKITQDSILAVAWKFIKEKGFSLGLNPQDLSIDMDALYVDDDVQFVKFRVFEDGKRNLDASVDLHFKKGHLVQLINHSYQETSPTLTSPNLPSLDQIKNLIAQEAAEFALVDEVESIGTYIRVRETAEGYEKVNIQRYLVKDQGHRQYYFDYDLYHKNFLAITPLQFYFTNEEVEPVEPAQNNGQAVGDIHPRWYKDAVIKTELPFVGLTAGNTNITTDAKGLFNVLNAQKPKLSGLKGSYVKVKPVTGTPLTLEGVLDGEKWNISYVKNGSNQAFADKDMAQTMAYNHTQKIIDYASQYIKVPWLQKPLNVNVNLGQTCNAYWDGSTTNFFSAGGRCANTALIADVIYHEWGHGLDANTGGIDDGAFSEGFGDIVSVLMTESNVLGIGFFTNGNPVRDLEPNKIYPKDRGEVHDEGLIIGGTFWDLYKSLKVKYDAPKARDLLSRYAFKSVLTASRYTDVYKAVLVIDDNDENLANGSPNFCEINLAFAEHGLAKKDPNCGQLTTDSST